MQVYAEIYQREIKREEIHMKLKELKKMMDRELTIVERIRFLLTGNI